MTIRDLGLLTAALSTMIVVGAAWSPIVLLGALLFPGAFQTFVSPVAATVDVIAICFRLATVIVFCSWIYLAGRNLIAAHIEDLDFTPLSRIWWFFIPVASFFKPYQGMRELWNASRGVVPHDVNDSLVGIWWALWLAAGIISFISGLVAGATGAVTKGIWISSAAYAALAVAAIMLIQGIAKGQRQLDGSDLSDVFR